MTHLRQGYGGQARLGRGYGAAGLLAAIAAIGLAAFGVVRGTWAVGGSDSSCYGLMAKAFAHGQLQPASALAADAPWPNAANTFAPGGFIPSTIAHDAAAPICAPGMSVLMAPLAAIFGQDAIFWLTPLAAALLVWSAFVIGRRLAGGAAGVTAAILVATSPIVLYQSVQPMNDVLTAALWMAALASARTPIVSGLLVGLAILVRPNLAPLSIIVAMLPLIEQTDGAARRLSIAMMAAAALPAVALMLWLNNALYGSALSTGYGSASALFAVANVGQNAANYGRAIWATQYGVPAVALLAPFVFDGVKRNLSLALLAFVAVTAGIYLFYSPFPEWWYLRFLMPALVVTLILASAVAVLLLARLGLSGVVPIVAVVLGILGTRAAGERQAFQLQRLEGRYRHSAQVVHDRLPENAVLITEWESGSIRFHADRDVVLWQSLDPAWLDRAVTWLRSKGLQPYLLFERGEERQFRERFRAHSDIGALDWPPRFDLNRQVRIFDPADRARVLAGESYVTENLR